MSNKPFNTPSNTPFDRRACIRLALAPLAAQWLCNIEAHAQTTGSNAESNAENKAESKVSQDLKARGLPSEGITLEFPSLADTGNAVPLRATVQATMGLSITSLEVILPENPNPSVIKLRLVEPPSRYIFTTRLRLAASQDAWVVVTLSDGSQRAASAPTIITSSACFDGT